MPRPFDVFVSHSSVDKPWVRQLIPVLLRDAELPGFLACRSWVDCRDRSAYAHSVWRLVWGITGQKPSTVHDLAVSEEQGEARPGMRAVVPSAAPAATSLGGSTATSARASPSTRPCART